MKTNLFLVYAFKCLCFSVAFGMAGYWIFKYSKNDDTTLIEYKPVVDSDSVALPAFSICLMANKKDADLNRYYENLTSVPALLDIIEHLDNITVYLRNETSGSASDDVIICKNPRKCLHVTFENNYIGYLSNYFTICFELKVKAKYSKFVYALVLKFKVVFEDLLNRIEMAFIQFHYPGQLFLDYRADHFLWKNRNDSTKFIAFKIDSIEILRRRTKANELCLKETTRYDFLKEKKLIENVGCKAPFHKFDNDIPICNDHGKLNKLTMLNLFHEHFLLPCEEMSHISFKSLEHNIDDGNGFYPLQVAYPEKIKIVTQKQSIDLHALIGYIGGYIGLFLGTSKIKTRTFSKYNFYLRMIDD